MIPGHRKDVSATVTLDKKGRLVLPKKVRVGARINVNSRLVVRVRGVGEVELFDPDLMMRRAQKIGVKKLAGWREEDHEAAELLSKLGEEHADGTR